MKRQNVLYPKAAKALKALGENLRLARRRRKITASMMAERANMSVMTLRSLERGSPHVSMCNYMAVIACLGFQDDIAAVASNDILGRDLQDAALGKRRCIFILIPNISENSRWKMSACAKRTCFNMRKNM